MHFGLRNIFMNKKKLILLDSFALAFRMFYAYAKNPLINSEGLNVSLVHGYWGAVFRILQKHQPTHFGIVCDTGKSNFRHELYPDYKANRGTMPEEMALQMPLLLETLAASGLAVLSEDGFEADDVMASVATCAEKEGFERVFLVTKDKDMAQIVDDCIHLFHLEKGADGIDFGPEQVLEKYGVPPSQMRDFLALTGDSSDNIPGVPKVGPKTAAELLKTFGDMDSLYARLGEVTKKVLKENLEIHREKAFMSRELVTLQSSRGFQGTLEQTEFRGVHRQELDSIFEKNEVHSLRRLLTSVPARGEAGLEIAAQISSEPQPQYICVNSSEIFEQMKSEFESADTIAVDTETDSLSSLTCKLVGLCLSCLESKGYYIPLGHVDDMGMEYRHFDFKQIRDWFIHLWKNQKRMWVFHNAKFDLHVLERAFHFSAFPARISDSLIAVWMISPGNQGYGLDEQIKRRFNHEMIPIESLIGRGKNQISFARVSVEEAFVYGAEDAVYTLKLWKVIEKDLETKGLMKLYRDMEMPILETLLEMEKAGVAINADTLKMLSEEIRERLAQIEKNIYKAAGGKEFNIGSTQQLAEILFDDLNLPVVKKTQTGRSTDSSVLEELSSSSPHPIVFEVMEYRELKKLQSTYVDVLPTLINPETGRIHTNFIQWGTATGRLSSREPNLQNIPIRTEFGKRIRAAFVPGGEDSVLLSADYSQIELRMLAHLSQDENLIEAYRRGEDIHAQTASAIYKVPLEEVNSDMRRSAKVINFGVLYGMTAFRLARDLKISRTEAKQFIDGYFDLYQGVRRFIDETIAFAHANGYVETISGRRRVIPGIDSSDRTECQMAERMAVNTPVQGSAADLIKIAMIRILKRIQTENLPLKMILQVHDELLFECPKSEAETLGFLIREEMENALVLDIPLVVSVGFGENWLEAH